MHFTTAAPTPLTKLLNARPVVHASSLFGQGAPRFKPLLKPCAEELVQRVSECMLAAPEAMGWKFGASLEGNRRRFDPAHYDPRWYDTSKSKVFAVGLTSNRLVQLLEQSLIDLPESVNHNASGLSIEYSEGLPAQVYGVPLRKGVSIEEFWQTRTPRTTHPPARPPARPPACALAVFDPLSIKQDMEMTHACHRSCFGRHLLLQGAAGVWHGQE